MTSAVFEVTWNGNTETLAYGTYLLPGEAQSFMFGEYLGLGELEISLVQVNGQEWSATEYIVPEASVSSTPDVLIQITTDNWPEETGWSITDDQGDEVAGSSVGTLAGNPNTTFTWEVELVPDGCYELTFFDAYGDGMFASQWGDYVDGAIDVYAMNGEGEPVSILWQYDGASGAMFAETSVGIEVSISCDDPDACLLWSDDFEGYPTGTYIAVAGAPDWETWIAGNEGTEMDSQISDEASVSGTQSMKIFSDNLAGGPMDVLYVAGETGQLELSFNLLVPEGYSGYYNFQENAIPGLDWAFECTISADGTASFVVDSDNVGSFALGAGWHNLSHLVDTENDRMNIYKDGEFMLQLPYDGLELGGVNFYAAGDDATLPLYYVDDMELYQAQPLFGCMDALACDYNPESMADDGSCTYPAIYDCQGACVNDADGDGICDELEVDCSVPPEESFLHPFISEYCEGSGNNKAIEIFNPNPFELQLGDYVLQRFGNGSTSSPDVMDLEGVISPFGTWVVVNGQSVDVPLGGGAISPAVDVNLQLFGGPIGNWRVSNSFVFQWRRRSCDCASTFPRGRRHFWKSWGRPGSSVDRRRGQWVCGRR